MPRRGSRTKPVVAVAAIHAVIAYAFISGLAMRVATYVDHPIEARNIPDDAPPPPKDFTPPKRIERASDSVIQQAIIERPTLGTETIEVKLTPIDPPTETTKPIDPPVLVKPPTPNLTRVAQPIGDRASWVTTDDYPPGALREGASGIVGIEVAIGVDGRVTACAVTGPSGNAQLDAATCRLYARRARFTPALDEQGHAIATRRMDRVRWRIPE